MCGNYREWVTLNERRFYVFEALLWKNKQSPNRLGTGVAYCKGIQFWLGFRDCSNVSDYSKFLNIPLHV